MAHCSTPRAMRALPVMLFNLTLAMIYEFQALLWAFLSLTNELTASPWFRACCNSP